MIEYRPILKFEVIEGEKKNSYIDISLDEFSWPAGGKGTCPFCGGKITGAGKDWACENEECQAKFKGPIF